MLMQSLQKTPVARLRQILGLSVEAFGELIDKSNSTVTKLETGILKLSEETAHEIAQQTGVAMQWLMEARPEEEPYLLDVFDGHARPWKKEFFETIQASKLEAQAKPFLELRDHSRLVGALRATGRWTSIYCSAVKQKKRGLAIYLMNKFLDELAERLGTDDAGAARVCQDAQLSLKDGSQYSFQTKEGKLYLKFNWETEKP